MKAFLQHLCLTLLIFCRAFWHCPSFGQNQQIDSLTNLVKLHTTEETHRVDLLNMLAGSYLKNNSKKANEYALKALALSDSIQYEKGNAIALRLIGEQSLLAMDYPVALSMATRALAKSEQLGLSSESLQNLILYATIQMQGGDHIDALENYTRALVLSKNTGEREATNTILTRLGLLNFYLDDLDEALRYSLDGLELVQKTGNHAQECTLLGNIALMYSAQQKQRLALATIEKAQTMALELGEASQIAQILVNLGTINAALGFEKKAIKNYSRAIGLSKKSGAIWPLCEGYLGLSQSQYKLGQYADAKKSAQKTLENAKVFYHFKISGMLVLSNVASAMGDYKNAYAHYQDYKKLSDHLLNRERIKKLAILENNYAFEKEKEILNAERDRKEALQEAEIERQAQLRNIATAIAVILFALVFVVFSNLVHKRRANKRLLAQKQEIEEQNNTMVELDRFKQNLMNTLVNDLKTPLNAIINLDANTTEESLNKTKQMGKQMLNMVFNILDVHKYEESKVEIKKGGHQLLAIADDAISEVDLMATNKSIFIENRIAPSTGVFCERELIERVFINLLTNAIRYSPKGAQIRVGATNKSSKKVAVWIADNGDGIDEALLPNIFEKYVQGNTQSMGDVRSTGLGLSFCKLAVESHGGTISAKSKKGEGATFTFTMNAATDFEVLSETSAYKAPKAFKKVVLGEEDKKMLRPYLEALGQVTVYEITKFKEIIAKLKVDSGPIAEWKQNLEESVLQLNEDNYRSLIQIEATQ